MFFLFFQCSFSSFGARPLHWACLFNRIQSLTYLLDNGSSPTGDSESLTPCPLLVAAKAGHTECVRKLLEKGADVEHADGSGRTALHLLSWFGHHEAIPLLLQSHAKIDVCDDSGHTALHFASWFDHIECCKVLIEGHCALDIKDKTGRTPLHFAVHHNHASIATLLLESGANAKIRDCDGKTPEAIAVADEKVEIVEILNSFAKKADLEEQQEASSAMPADEFMEEHNHLRETIRRLVDDGHMLCAEVMGLQDKIEGQNAAISVLQTRQAEMRQHVIELGNVLVTVLSSLTAATVGRSRVSPATSTDQTPSVKFPSASDRSVVPMCRMCGQNQASMRCKVCKSPLCQQCMPAIKQKGCPYCPTV
jgi:ankyrin repeat protein